jgi:O-acetyl-ADP-ribose deacetylase (regulator of RNase III)
MLKDYLPFLFKKNGLFPAKPAPTQEELNSLEYRFDVKIRLERGSITRVRADAMVNSTNRLLQAGGGIDWAIHAAAGKELEKELAQYDSCDEGDVVVSKGYNLPCTHIIHTVTPYWSSPSDTNMERLRNCYRNIFKAADELGVKSLAIPAIGTGVHETPIDISALVAREEFEAHFTDYEGTIEDVIFVLHSSTDFNTYTNAFDQHELAKPEDPKLQSLSFTCTQKTIELKGHFHVNIVPSKLNKISAFAKGIDFNNVDIIDDLGVMTIESYLDDPVVLNIASWMITKVIFNGEGSFEFEDLLKPSLSLEFNGDIDATLIGIIEDLSINAVGDGNIDAKRSLTKNLSIVQQGLYEIQAHASEHLHLVKEGFGDVIITGSPKHVESHDQGIGTVTIS